MLPNQRTNNNDLNRNFGCVAEQYRPRIFRFFLGSFRDADLADTMTQDCLLRAHRSWPSFRGDSDPSTWLMRIAINLQKDYWRSRRLQFWRKTVAQSLDYEDACALITSGESSPEARVIATEQVVLVWKVVGELPYKQRSVFLLRIVEELKFGEIAELMGMSEGTIKSHLSRALNKVREELKVRSHNPSAPYQ